MLIYGYDDENVYIYMYNESKLTSHTVSYDNFLRGYYSEYCDEDFYRNRAILFKPNDKVCEVNLEKIRWHMHDYLNGIETFAREKPNIFNPDSLTMNGIDTYAEFDSLFDYVLENEYKNLRKTDMYCLYEHKKIMLERVVYLNERGLLKASSELIDEFDSIEKLSQQLMLLGLKVNAMNEPKRKNSTLLVMKNKINVLKQKEESVWNKYIAGNHEVLG